MNPKKKSPRRNASQPRRSNSPAVRSQVSAKKKSRRSSDELRVATPTDPRSEWLHQQGLIVPDNLDPGEEIVPLDFTHLSNPAVGALHSRFAVRHAHALFVRADIASRLLRLTRVQRIALARYRARHVEEFKTARELEGAFATGPGMKTSREIMELEIKAELLDAVIGGYDDVVKAASREMSRRDSERAPRD